MRGFHCEAALLRFDAFSFWRLSGGRRLLFSSLKVNRLCVYNESVQMLHSMLQVGK